MMNGSIKEEFIKSGDKKESTQKVVKWVFIRAFEYEQKFNKDVFDFKKEEYEDLFLNRKLSSDTLEVYISYLSSYIDYVLKHHPQKIRRGRNPFKEDIDVDEFVKKIAKKKQKLLHFNEFSGMLEDDNSEYVKRSLLNYSDKLLVYLLWYGVSGSELNELRNLKYDDVKGNTLNLNDNGYARELVIPPYGIELIEKTKKENKLYKYVEDEGSHHNGELQLEYSPYVFRRSNSGIKEGSETVSQYTLTKRLKAMGDYVGIKLTPNLLEKSGKAYMTKRMIEEGVEFTVDNFTKHIVKRYNMSETYLNVMSQKDKIIKDMKELYPEVDTKMVDARFKKKG